MAKNHMKNYSTLLVIGEMLIKTIKRYYFIPTDMAIMKNKKSCQSCGEIEMLVHCRKEYKMIWPLWKTVWLFFKKLKIELPYELEIPPQRIER